MFRFPSTGRKQAALDTRGEACLRRRFLAFDSDLRHVCELGLRSKGGHEMEYVMVGPQLADESRNSRMPRICAQQLTL